MWNMAIAVDNKKLMEWFDHLESQGLAPKNLKRVIIDIQWDSVPVVYYECYADESMFKFDLSDVLKGAKFQKLEANE
jgi:hypothetical protein